MERVPCGLRAATREKHNSSTFNVMEGWENYQWSGSKGTVIPERQYVISRQWRNSSSSVFSNQKAGNVEGLSSRIDIKANKKKRAKVR